MNEKYEANLLPTRTQSQASFAISWCVAGVVTFFCLLLALASRGAIQPFAALFQGLGVELPWPTRFLLTTYFWLLPLLYLGLAVSAVLFQFSSRDFRARLLAAVRIFLVALVSAGLFVFILYLPLLALTEKLSGTH
jgi:hypothetical protein